MSFEKLKKEVLNWAEDRDLLSRNNRFKQWGKTLEEVKEIYDAMLEDDTAQIQDGIGDAMVTLIILAEQNGLNALGCLESAYNEIKNRKGKTVDGIFIKDEGN